MGRPHACQSHCKQLYSQVLCPFPECVNLSCFPGDLPSLESGREKHSEGFSTDNSDTLTRSNGNILREDKGLVAVLLSRRSAPRPEHPHPPFFPLLLCCPRHLGPFPGPRADPRARETPPERPVPTRLSGPHASSSSSTALRLTCGIRIAFCCVLNVRYSEGPSVTLK